MIVGSLRSRIKATGRITASQFALVLTIAQGTVTRFQMLSLWVSQKLAWDSPAENLPAYEKVGLHRVIDVAETGTE